MNANLIKKYDKYSAAKLKQLAQKHFNAWIRKRDEGQLCISCGANNPEQAGHFYSAGHHNIIRFNEDNCHLQCRRCNYYLSGNLINYRKSLEKKIGKERLEKLDMLASIKKAHKHDRFTLIDIINKYT